MPLSIDNFSGIVPKLSPETLPDNAAQAAHNCDVTSGAIKSLTVTGPYNTLHDGSGYLLPGIPSGDLKQITKPAAPTVNTTEYICKPENWLTISAYDWISYIDNTTGNRVVTRARADLLPLQYVRYTETGMFVICYLLAKTYTFAFGGPYFLKGPRYQFGMAADPSHLYGGPEEAWSMPAYATEGDPEIPEQRIPLFDSNGQVYAFFQVKDVYGPHYDETMLVKDYASTDWQVPGYGNGFVIFDIDLNYVESSRKRLFYVQSALTEYLEEGPPSELSADITVKPGQVLTLNTPRPVGYTKNRLYRSTTGHDDFLLVDDINADTYQDLKVSLRADEIPPYGNHPGVAEEFLRGSIVHPAQFGLALYNDTVYASDFYRFFAWPDEYTIPLTGETQLGMAMTGNTALVFTTNNVYGIAGGNPDSLQKYLISSTAPLLGVESLCKIGGTVFWATSDGLAASTGSGVEIITAGHFTRDQWLAYAPATMKATTADNSIFLECAGGTHLRFDLDEKLAAVTTYVSTSGGTYRWKSKRFWFAQPTIFDFARVVADGTVTLKVYADRSLVATKSMTSDAHVALSATSLNPANEWEFQVEGTAAVMKIEAFDRVVHTVDGNEVRLTAENTPIFRSTYLKFTDSDAFCLGSLSVQKSTSVPIKLYGDGVLVHTQTVTSGRAFTLPRTLPKATVWRVDVDADSRIDELILIRRSAVQATDIREVNNGPVCPWLTKRYEYAARTRLRSVIVDSATYPLTMSLYADGSTTETASVTIAGAGETLITYDGVIGCVEFNFGGTNDPSVRDVILMQTQDITGADGIQLNSPPSWRGLRYKFPDRGSWACGSLGASSYSSVEMDLYAEGSLVHTQTVTDGHVWMVPRTVAQAANWMMDIRTAAVVDNIILLPWERVPVEKTIRLIGNETGIPPWMHSKYELADGSRLGSISVVADSYPLTLNLYPDGATSPTAVTVSDSAEIRMTDVLGLVSDLTFDFAGSDYLVNEVWAYVKQEQNVGDGVTFTDSLRGNLCKFAEPSSFACGLVTASGYGSITLKLYGNGTLRHTESVTSGEVFLIPRTVGKYVTWEADLEVASTIEGVELTLLPWRHEAVAGTVQVMSGNGGIPGWMHTVYEFQSPVLLRSAVVKASGTVSLRLFVDNGSSVSQTVSVTSAGEVALTALGCSSLSFDFNGDDGDVYEAKVFAEETIPVGAGGLVLSGVGGAPAWRNKVLRFKDTGSWSVARVVATEYPVTMKLSSGGSVRQTVVVSSSDEFKLSTSLPNARDWSLDLAHTGDITELVLVSRDLNRVEDGAVRIVKEQDPWSWLARRVLAPSPVAFTAGRVTADAYPVTLRLYGNGTLVHTRSVADGDPFRIPSSRIEREWSVDVVAAESVAVYEVALAGSMDRVRL